MTKRTSLHVLDRRLRNRFLIDGFREVPRHIRRLKKNVGLLHGHLAPRRGRLCHLVLHHLIGFNLSYIAIWY